MYRDPDTGLPVLLMELMDAIVPLTIDKNNNIMQILCTHQHDLLNFMYSLLHNIIIRG